MLKEIPKTRFKNIYRISSTRLEEYDYGKEGLYYVTLCTSKKMQYFGKIVGKEIQLSRIGVLTDVLWYELKNHYDNIELHEFIVMPNHIHGIIEIINKCRDDACIVSDINANEMARISPKSSSLARIVGSYKSAVSKHSHRLGYDFEWQPRFYDRIIRNSKEYLRIAYYIKSNPANWENDELIPIML